MRGRTLGAALWLLAVTADALPMQRVLFSEQFAEATGARCLDGTPAGYYLREAPQPTSDWVIFLQGGGLCVTFADCRKRAKTDLGSSSKWPATRDDGNNVVGSDPAENPFADFNHVFMPYCSGDTWTGGRHGKSIYLGELYTAGHLIIDAAMTHLANSSKAMQAQGVTRLLLSGASAGGLGVVHNADHVRSLVTDTLGYPSAMVKAAPQAGLYFPTGAMNYQSFELLGMHAPHFDILASHYVEWMEDAVLDASCMAARGHQKLCWDAAIAVDYVETPLFIAENQYDQNQLSDILVCKGCSATAVKTPKRFMEDFGRRMRSTLRGIAANSTNNISIFSPSCFSHTQNLCMSAGPVVLGWTFNQSLAAWFFEDKRSVIIDDCTSDMPCNAVCNC